MKKTYINPEMDIVKVQTVQMLAGSAHVEKTEDTVTSESDLLGHDDEFDW